eukprot:11517696-Alexandrium_andersonii.AAC.1
MGRAAGAGTSGQRTHTLLFAASPADDSGAATGAAQHYVPGMIVEPGPWVTAESGVVARQYVHPASLASVTCCWTAARVPRSAAGDLAFDPRAAREVMETAGPPLSRAEADVTSGPLRLVLWQRQEWFVRAERGAVVTVAGA